MIALLIALLAVIAVTLIFADLFGLTRRVRLPDAPQVGFLSRYLENLRIELHDSGMEDFSPERFIAITALIAVASGLLVWFVLGCRMIAVLLALWLLAGGFRNLYIGRRALARRIAATEQVAEAAREIADALEVGESPTAALAAYAARAKPGAASEKLTGVDNIVAKALLNAIYQRDVRGAKQEVALRMAAEAEGNRWFSNFVETFIQNVDTSNAQLAAGLRRVATEIDYALQLRLERITALNPALTSYKMVGGVIIGLIFFSSLISPQARDFWTGGAYRDPLDVSGYLGQIVLLLMGAWWYLGLSILRRKLNDRI